MIKKPIYPLALAALLSASSIALAGGPEYVPVEDFFNGFYVGGTGSVHHADFDGSSFVDLTAPVVIAGVPIIGPGNLINGNIDNSSVDGYGGVQGGFGWTFNHFWYLGIQGFGEFGTQSQSSTSTFVPVNVNILNLVTDTTTITNNSFVKIKNDYGVAGKIGLVVAPRTMVYGKVGASWAKLRVANTATAVNSFNIVPPIVLNVTTTAAANTSNQQTKLGLLLGIGAEQFIWNDVVSLNVEYDYVNYGAVTTPTVNLIGGSTVTAFGVGPFGTPPVVLPVTTHSSSNATVSSILGGINFYFGRHWF